MRSRLSTAVKHPGPTVEAEVDEAAVDEEVKGEDSSRQVLYVKYGSLWCRRTHKGGVLLSASHTKRLHVAAVRRPES